MERKYLTLTLTTFALLLAATPTLRWYVLRLQDGGELAGLVPLVAAVWFTFRDRKSLNYSSKAFWVGVLFLLIQAASYPVLPAMVRALLMIGTLCFVSGIWRKPGIVCLCLLALPWAASLDFFLGYPLRLLTSINVELLLGTLGMDIKRAGVQLLHQDQVVGVDPACSGTNLLWNTGLLTALLAALFSLRWKPMVPLGAAALALALAGNSLRAAILFFPEAKLIQMPHFLHSGIGVAIAAGCFLILMKLTRRLSRTHPSLSTNSSEKSRGNAATAALAMSAILVFAASCSSPVESTRPTPKPSNLSSYHGTPVRQIALSAAEETFYKDFPGSIAVYEAEGFKLIIRQVNHATRKLHPASHCLRAEGFSIGPKTVTKDQHDSKWLSYSVSRNGETFRVKERITCMSSKQGWPEIPAWYWHAFLHPSQGPWEAVTVISL
ncbi:MAG: archaeosortase/exosortase family protein [Akkermansiaceae bacterium]